MLQVSLRRFRGWVSIGGRHIDSVSALPHVNISLRRKSATILKLSIYLPDISVLRGFLTAYPFDLAEYIAGIQFVRPILDR